MSHPHQGMPATPAEIAEALDLLRLVAADLTARPQDNLRTAGQVIRGMVDAFEGCRAVGGPNPWESGHRVGRSLLAGGSRYL